MSDRARYRVTRDVTTEECDWLTDNVAEGTVVYEFRGSTYGCVNWQTGIAVTLQPDQAPFLELPLDALEWLA